MLHIQIEDDRLEGTDVADQEAEDEEEEQTQ
jgi:hypothetical protein